jgi:hypothetical protein
MNCGLCLIVYVETEYGVGIYTDIRKVEITIKSTNDIILYTYNKTFEASFYFNKFIVPTTAFYGDCTATFSLARENGETETYEFYISVESVYAALRYKNHSFTNTIPDLILDLNCEGLTKTVKEDNLSQISVLSANGTECYDHTPDTIRITESNIYIPFTRSGTETNYRLTIPKGTLLLDGGWNEEFILDFVTDTAFADEREYLISTEPLNASIVYLNAETESLPMSVKLSKDCVIDPNMKIEVNDMPVNCQIADESEIKRVTAINFVNEVINTTNSYRVVSLNEMR